MHDLAQFHAQFALIVVLMVFLAGATAWATARSRFWEHVTWRELAALTGLVALALVARSFVEPFVANYQLSTVQGVYIGQGHRWTAGFSALVHGLFAAFPPTLATLSKANIAISVATIVVVYAFVRVGFDDRLAAFAAAAVTAFHPVLARYAASDSPHVLLALCLMTGGLFVVLWTRDDRRLLLLLGAGWLGLAANVRNEAVSYVAVGALLVAGWTGALTPRRRAHVRDALILFTVVSFQPLVMVLAEIGQKAHDLAPLGVFEAFFLSSQSPLLLGLMAALGLVASARARPKRTLLLLAAMWIVSLPTGYCVGECAECQEISFRHLQPHFVSWTVFTGLGFSAAWMWLAAAYRRWRARPTGEMTASPTPGPRYAAVVLVTVVALTCATRIPFLFKEWTLTRECAFLARHLPDIPDGCVVIGIQVPNEMAGLRLTSDLSVDVGRHHEWIGGDGIDEIRNQVETGRCVVFYRGTNCHAYEACRYDGRPNWGGVERPVCAEIMDDYLAEPIATEMLPTQPYACEAYTVSPIPVGLYVLRAR